MWRMIAHGGGRGSLKCFLEGKFYRWRQGEATPMPSVTYPNTVNARSQFDIKLY